MIKKKILVTICSATIAALLFSGGAVIGANYKKTPNTPNAPNNSFASSAETDKSENKQPANETDNSKTDTYVDKMIVKHFFNDLEVEKDYSLEIINKYNLKTNEPFDIVITNNGKSVSTSYVYTFKDSKGNIDASHYSSLTTNSKTNEIREELYTPLIADKSEDDAMKILDSVSSHTMEYTYNPLIK